MQNARRLVEHYNQKYRQSNYTLVKPVPVVRYPKDRFEMAALTAFSSGGGDIWKLGLDPATLP